LANLSFNELVELQGILFPNLESWSQHVIRDIANL
jgi:hypothetical protein